MGHFTKEYMNFFMELALDNSKEWFDQNRERYKEHVKQPFENFVTSLIHGIQEFDPDITIEPKKAIFRINRDIRFSKDKTPYKLHMAASFSRTARKEEDFAGYYIHLSPYYLHVGGGVYFINKEGLNSVRQYISDHPQKFIEVTSSVKFRSSYNEILGDRLKRVPREYRSLAEQVPQIANKQFYFTRELDSSLILDNELVEIVLRHYRNALEFNQMMREALIYK